MDSLSMNWTGQLCRQLPGQSERLYAVWSDLNRKHDYAIFDQDVGSFFAIFRVRLTWRRQAVPLKHALPRWRTVGRTINTKLSLSCRHRRSSFVMISRRDKLLNYPWEVQRYEQHREKVRSAKAAIDAHMPRQHEHVQRKLKKMQNEKERKQQIERENVRLLQKLGDIMRSKRMNNLWLEPRPNFLNREKLFETRPYSSLPKLVTIYGTAKSSDRQITPKTTNSAKPKTAARCPTCSGQPERTEVLIPESRIPWAPPRRSWSTKTDKRAELKRCYHCGCYQKSRNSYISDFFFE